MKIVINTCYGGYSLSHEAVLRYFEIKGIEVYPEQDTTAWKFWTYWTVKPEDRITAKKGKDFYAMSLVDRVNYNEAYSKQTLSSRDFERHDPVLVQVVEEMGKASWGEHAELAVVKIPDGIRYEINEYDGNEHIAEEHRTWS